MEKKCRICEYCEIAFTVGEATQKFCSHFCYSLNKRELSYRNCDFCGEKYRPTSRKDNQKFCSRKCYGDYKAKEATKDMVCEYCGCDYKAFGVKNWKASKNRKERMFCSKKCADKDRIGKYTRDNSPQWKGGRTSLQDLIRKSADYMAIRKLCFERDDYKSVLTGGTGRLRHHHLKSSSIIFNENGITKDNWRNNKNILFDIDNDNVVTLTEKEHKKFHSIYGKVTTKEHFEEFKSRYEAGGLE